MNILIAEDNELIQTFHKRMINAWGYKFDLATNGMEAVELAKKNNGKYDLCLMDVEMPMMSGIEATKLIRKAVRYFPIMGFTSNSSYEAACYDAGMDDFAVKPCLPDELFDKIRGLSVKLYELIVSPYVIDITEVMPVDKQHAEELTSLAKQDLCKMNIRGVGEHDLTVIVHKNVPYKISNDFVGKSDDVSVFLDRTPDKPAECHLYKSSFPMPAVYLTEDVFDEKLKAENELLKGCTKMVLKNNEK